MLKSPDPPFPAAAAAKPRREEIPAGRILCEYCTAKCCRYFAVPLETPTRKRDYEYMRWYLLHEHAGVFVEKGTWYLLVQTVCRHLREDQRCGIYDARPAICRDYSTKDCEYDDDWTYDRFFERPEQMAEYAEALRSSRGGGGVRGPRPPLLPVIG
jgi:Fe-S-cluster containining protein